MQANHKPVLDPAVRIVIAHRGYGKTQLSLQLPIVRLWGPADATGFHVIDVQPWDDPNAALKYAQSIEDYCRALRPRIQTRVFMRTEHWERMKGIRAHAWITTRKGAVWEMPPFFVCAVPSLRDMRGVTLPETGKSADSLEFRAESWVSNQPERTWLQAALPIADEGYKIPIAIATQRMSAYLDRHPDTFTAGCKTPRKFLEHCELIGAGRRVAGPSWEWAPIWLVGCRALARHSA